jgi:hypothetical protein
MDESHLIAAVRYVSLNPVRARLARKADDAASNVLYRPGQEPGRDDAPADSNPLWRGSIRCRCELRDRGSYDSGG